MPKMNNEGWLLQEDTAGYEPAQCKDVLGDDTLVALIIGQSNAANCVEEAYSPGRDVFMYYDKACYRAKDPLLGVSGSGTSVWTRLGDKVVATGLFKKALFIPLARQGSSILNWGRYGDLHYLLKSVFHDLDKRGIRPQCVFFHQGESDCQTGMDGEDYAQVLQDLIRDVRVMAGYPIPFFIARASAGMEPVCPAGMDISCFKKCDSIVEAQASVIDPSNLVFPGPNSDELLPYSERRDGVHFSGSGAEIFAQDFLRILKAHYAPAP